MSAMHGKAGYNGAEKRALSKYIIAIVAIVAAIACCAVLLAALPGCGGDMLATTTQAQSGSQAASVADSASAEAQATSASASSVYVRPTASVSGCVSVMVPSAAFSP